MASKSKAIAGRSRRVVGLSNSKLPFQPVHTPPAGGAAPKAISPDSSDPTGVKSYIAFSVAHGIYPHGAEIDPSQDISDDVALNSPTIAAEINFDALHLATMHQLTWDQVSPSDVQKLATVADLVALVKKNLS